MYEIQQDMKDLEEEDGGFDGRIESDSSEVDSLEAFAAMDEEPEDQNMASASDPQPAAGDPIDLDADIPQTHSEESQDSQEFGVDFKF